MIMSLLIRRPSLTLTAIVAILAIVVGVSAVTASVEGPTSTEQNGIKFSHKFHVQETGIACADCHTKVTTSKLAGDQLRPDHTNCESCHQEQLENSCTTCHTSEDPLSYAAAPAVDRELVFSHQQHLEQGTACVTCHVGVDQLEEPAGHHVPTMATCNTCHDDVQATNACEVCHTNLASLRPVEHNRVDFLKEHKKVAQRMDANCASCHTEESCSDCHNGSDLQQVNVPGTDLTGERGPRTFAISRGQGMRLTKVHDLNFRYTHGLAAKGKSSECQTCHESQSFCSTCHMAGGDVNQAAFRPAGHNLAGFVTIGVGSGGGEHARMAKRDIESCASCHDPEAADPTCVTCHVDPDGIKGTQAKTHERGFMADVEGDWHKDPGTNCYVCHTDANARPGGVKGQKFCGYCHN